VTFRKILLIGILAGIASLPLCGQNDDDALDPAVVSARADVGEANDQAASEETKNSRPNPLEDPRDRVYYPGDTERFKPLITKLGGNVLLDQKQIWTSPFHINKKNAKWWIGFGAVTAALIATDRHTINTFENSPGQITWSGRVSDIGAEYTLVPLVAGFYGYGVWKQNAQAREVGVLGTESLLDALVVVSVLKEVAGRNRPDNPQVGERGEFFEGGSSFPSGHAIESWAIASLVAHEYKKYNGRFVPYLAYGLATGVSLSRFAAQRHYASDIVAGAAMGWFIGRFVYQTHETHASHHHAWARPRIGPDIDPLTRTYTLSLGFSP
jgi:membrane-associated phospholipid phosphatase